MERLKANTILVVDDEASLRYFLAEELAGHGYQVYTAMDGRKALTFLEQTSVDLTIIDLQMPGLNGLELMTALQFLPDSPELIMLTAHATLETAIEAMRHGCSDFLLKPYNIDELLQGVERALAYRRQKLQQKMAARLLADSLGLGEVSQERNGAEEPQSNGENLLLSLAPSRSSFTIRGLTVDMEAMSVIKDGQSLSLTPTEFRLLVTLMKRPNHPHTFQELAEVTHHQQVDGWQARDLLKSHIGRLRHKLNQAPDRRPYLANVRGVGYKFVSEEKRS